MDEWSDKKTSVAVVADSVAQIPADIARQLDITILPFIVNINGQQYTDGGNLVLSELYRRMRQEKTVPTTSAPPPVEYHDAFHSRLQAGAQAVVCVTLSSKLSSGYSHACLAAAEVRKEFPDRAIEVFDSQQATLSEGFIAIAAAQAAMRLESIMEVLQVTWETARHVGLTAALDTLEYLARGGRIGKVAYLAGSLIKIRPVIRIDEQGMLSPIGTVRSEIRALQTMVDYVAGKKEKDRHLILGILEADAKEQAARLKEMAIQKLEPFKVYEAELTPVMGAHAGPGVVGLSYYFE